MADPEVFDLELTKIFDRSWVFVAHESEVPLPGDYVARGIGRDAVLVVRDPSGSLSVLLNVCSHRGSRVCESEHGTTRTFRCPYHGWTYGTDGRLIGIPMEREVFGDALDRSTLGLASARVSTFHGLVFATWDIDAPSLTEHLGVMTFYLDTVFGLTERGTEVVGPPQRWRVRTNWKIPADNFAGDPYHVRSAHGSMSALNLIPLRDESDTGIVAISDPDRGHAAECTVLPHRDRTDDERLAASCRMHGVPDAGADELRQRLTPEQLEQLLSYPVALGTVFPNFSFLRAPLRTEIDGSFAPAFTIRIWHPVSVDVTEVWSWALVHRDAHADIKARVAQAVVRTFGSSGMAEQDDTEIWTRMQQGFSGTQGRERRLRYRPHQESDATWSGPGFARRGPQGEHRQWHFYCRWQAMLRA